jgi:hypothetical protein
LTDSAREFGLLAAGRYYRLVLAAFATLSDQPVQSVSDDTLLPPGVRVHPLSLARRLNLDVEEAGLNQLIVRAALGLNLVDFPKVRVSQRHQSICRTPSVDDAWAIMSIFNRM